MARGPAGLPSALTPPAHALPHLPLLGTEGGNHWVLGAAFSPDGQVGLVSWKPKVCSKYQAFVGIPPASPGEQNWEFSSALRGEGKPGHAVGDWAPGLLHLI